MPAKLLERDIERTIVDFLTTDGWICRKMELNFSERKRKSVGELGMADQLCIRYVGHKCNSPESCSGEHCFPHDAARTRVMWIEFKREKGGSGKRGLYTKAEKAKIHQKAWHAAERARGALTLIAGEDFPASIEGFQDWYFSSGLARRVQPSNLVQERAKKTAVARA